MEDLMDFTAIAIGGTLAAALQPDFGHDAWASVVLGNVVIALLLSL